MLVTAYDQATEDPQRGLAAALYAELVFNGSERQRAYDYAAHAQALAPGVERVEKIYADIKNAVAHLDESDIPRGFGSTAFKPLVMRRSTKP